MKPHIHRQNGLWFISLQGKLIAAAGTMAAVFKAGRAWWRLQTHVEPGDGC